MTAAPLLPQIRIDERASIGETRAFLERDRLMAAYALADLDPESGDRARWWLARREGEAVACVLLVEMLTGSLPFRAANRNDWGGMDWMDVNAGIDAVIAQGIADPKRMGFMGWSYGGYLAAWAIARSDRFKAISVGAPVVDLLSFHGTTDIRDFLPHYFPPSPLSLEQLRAHSPIWHLKKTTAKVLIQHVEGDLRVPFSQGLMLYRLLDELGVDVTMVAYPGSAHTPSEPKRRIDAARRNVELFEKNVK